MYVYVYVYACNSDEVTTLINDVHRQYLDPTKGVFEVVDPNIGTIISSTWNCYRAQCILYDT
jgi:hypothetical protein